MPEVTWQQSQEWEPRVPNSGAAWGGIYTSQFLLKTQLASGCGGCLESPKALPSPGSWPPGGFRWCPRAWHPGAGGKGEG